MIQESRLPIRPQLPRGQIHFGGRSGIRKLRRGNLAVSAYRHPRNRGTGNKYERRVVLEINLLRS
jgi:hypothetical protein